MLYLIMYAFVMWVIQKINFCEAPESEKEVRQDLETDSDIFVLHWEHLCHEHVQLVTTLEPTETSLLKSWVTAAHLEFTREANSPWEEIKKTLERQLQQTSLDIPGLCVLAFACMSECVGASVSAP